MKIHTKHRFGFTILEVLIVLAIAALILSMVFLAVNAANRSSRDTKRKSDALEFSGALEQWAQNHSGSLPILSTDIFLSGANALTTKTTPINPSDTDFCTQNYLPNHCSNFKDPGTAKGYTFTHAGAADQSFSVINPAPAFSCSGSIDVGNMQVNYTSSRDYTIKVCLEAGVYNLNP